jgi:hypothetical protein
LGIAASSRGFDEGSFVLVGFCTVDFDVDVERVVVVAGVVGSLEEVMIDYLTSRVLEMYISTVLV